MKDKTIDYVLRATWIAVSKMYNEEAKKKDSTMATGFTLISIDPEKGTPSTSLGPKMGMESTSLSRLLKTMEKKKLITRKKNPKDGRGVLIQLTEFGQEMREFSKEVVLQFDETVKESISEKDFKTFLKVSEKIMEIATEKKHMERES